MDSDWYYAWKWAPDKAKAIWTGSGNCGMAPLLVLKKAIESGDEELAKQVTLDYETPTQHCSQKETFMTFLFTISNLKRFVSTQLD